MLMRKPPPPEGPPTTNEITHSIEQAGYPVEIRVFQRLQAREMSPSFGMRLPVDDSGTTFEVDVLAENHQNPDGGPFINLILPIQVKRLPLGSFVGLMHNTPPQAGLQRYWRTLVAGFPSFHADNTMASHITA